MTILGMELEIIMNLNAKENIKRKIEGSLQNVYVQEGWPSYDSYNVHVASLSEEILKHKKEWLRRRDVFSIFLDHVYKEIEKKYSDDKGITGELKTLFSETELSSLSDSLCEYIESIPREYEVYLPLPAINELQRNSIELYEGVWLKSFDRSENIPGGGSPTGTILGGMRERKLEKNEVYLCLREKGYVSFSIDSYTISEALLGFKVLLSRGLSGSFFELQEQDNHYGFGLMRSIHHHQIPKVSLISVDLNSTQNEVIKSQLPLDLTMFINKICLTHNSKDLIEKKARDKLKIAAKLSRGKEGYALPIKSAIEWAVNSMIEESETLSFIQMCIGFECVLGDIGDMPVTATLADRLAYIVGMNPKMRQEIRDEFKKMYSIRSKLVHGNSSKLREEERRELAWGGIMLDLVISKEIKNYMASIKE